MATAVANSKTLTDAPTRSIWAPSLLGAAIVLGGLALILQGIPQLWASGVAPTLQSTIGNSANAALRVAAQEPFTARALIYALLLDQRADLRNRQLVRLKGDAEPPDLAATVRLVAPVQALTDNLRLPLLDLAMPALRQMSPPQHQAFRAQVEALMNDDQRVSLFEYTLRCVLHRHLDAQFLPQSSRGPMQSSPQKLVSPMAKALSLLAWEGQPEPEKANRAFDTGMRSFIGDEYTVRLTPREKCGLAEFDVALQTLNQSVPTVKRRIVVACAACIRADKKVTVRETELLRGICDTLDCPLPPLAMVETQ